MGGIWCNPVNVCDLAQLRPYLSEIVGLVHDLQVRKNINFCFSMSLGFGPKNNMNFFLSMILGSTWCGCSFGSLRHDGKARKLEMATPKPNKKCVRELEWCESCECGMPKDKTSLDLHFSSKSHKRKEMLLMLASFFARHSLHYFPVGVSHRLLMLCRGIQVLGVGMRFRGTAPTLPRCYPARMWIQSVLACQGFFGVLGCTGPWPLKTLK